MNRHPDLESLRDPESRAELLRHVAACRVCRERLALEDPTAQFGLLGIMTLPEDRLERLSENVARAIEPRPRTRALGALAASILLAGALGVFLLSRPVPVPPGERAEADRAVQELLQRAAPVPGVELLSSPGSAQLVDFEVGETHVVMIFDEDLDI